MPSDSWDVVIIGAGAAGLMAARELAVSGKRVVTLEARDRLGGRIYPLSEQQFGYPAQGGAEFVHGDAPLTREILTRAGATLEHPTEWWNVFDGEPKKTEFLSPYDPILANRLRALTEDMSIAAFFDRFFPEAEHATMRDLIFLRTEGYDAADPKRASAFRLRDELLDESDWKQLNIKEGYGLLLRTLANESLEYGAKIILQSPVKSLTCRDGGVIVTCRNGTVIEAAQAIVTVPLPVLSDIQWTPPITEKIAAADRIGFGPVIKLLLRFKSKWWSGDRAKPFERMFFMFSHEEIPTWWTQYPQPHATLTGWVAGPHALTLSGLPEEQLTEKGLISLSRIFKIGIDELRGELLTSAAVDWAADPYARGAYSYVTPESHDAIETILEPVENKIFFAGEGVYQGNAIGTVEAALESGRAAAARLLE